jgi:hypothetical protein
MKPQNKRVCCVDGYSVSIQASETSYCAPRDDIGPYTSVELGFPSAYDTLLDGYAENKHAPTDTVYGYVPSSTAELLIVKHGGAVSGQVPEGVLMLMAPSHRERKEETDDG